MQQAVTEECSTSKSRQFRQQCLFALIILFIVYAFLFVSISMSTARWFTFENLGIDDANIFFTYAKNFVAEHQLVWTLGGERIEGFTSPLWLFICTFFFSLTPEPETHLFVVNLLITAFAVSFYFVTFATLPLTGERSTIIESPILGSLAVIFLSLPCWLIASPAYLAWNLMSLMDTALWSSLILMTISLTYRCIDRSAGLRTCSFYCLTLIALCLTRPEGLGLSLLSVLCLVSGLRV